MLAHAGCNSAPHALEYLYIISITRERERERERETKSVIHPWIP